VFFSRNYIKVVILIFDENKTLTCRRETALQGALVLAKSERLELKDNILRTL